MGVPSDFEVIIPPSGGGGGGGGGSMTGSEILAELATVDGAGSGLDADTVDGQQAAAFVSASTLTEQVQDIIASMIQPGANIVLVYDDTNGVFTIGVTGLTEPVQDIVGAFTSGAGGVTVAYDDTANSLTISIANGALALAKLADIATGRLLGNVSGVAGAPVELTSAQVKTFLSLVKADVGLGNVDNTSDANKPVSAATATALAGKVDTTRTITAGTGLAGGGSLAADRTLSVTDDSTVQKLEIAKNGTLIGARKRLNLIEGTNVTLTAADSGVNNRVDVTVTATGGAGGGATTLDQLTDVVVTSPSGGQTLTYNAGSGQWVNSTPSAGTAWNVLVTVTSDGSTDVSASIQAVLDGLTSGSHSYEVIVEGATKGGTIYLNGKVRITTNNTKVRFLAPVKIGTTVDPDGFGGLSILGTSVGTTTVSSGATRGSSVIVVASATNITAGRLIRLYDTDSSGGGQATWKQEMAQVVAVSGTTVYLDHALYQTYTGTITCEAVNPVVNSGFEDVSATFQGQEPSGQFRFTCKMQYVKDCYFRNVRLKGTTTNSWSREAINTRYAHRCVIERCETVQSWNTDQASTYSYGFSADGATECVWRDCYASNLRHGFSADKGSCGCLYSNCTSDGVMASGFDLHGNWCRDITYTGCRADSSPNMISARDGQRVGFLSGNTTFVNGVSNITYNGCVARNFVPYTTSNGGSGDGAGFGVVDGCSNIVFQSCRVYDCEMGIYVLSEIGQPILNVGIYDCEFTNLTSVNDNIPIRVNAGAAPQDVNGLVIDGCRFVAGNSMSSILITGTPGNTLADFVITNCVFNRSTFVTGVHAFDIRYVDNLVIASNVFNRTNRGIILQNCPSACVVLNVFAALGNATDASHTFQDAGGNTNMVFAKNILVGYQPSSNTVAPSSSGAYVEYGPAKQVYATAGRPSAAVVRAGTSYFDTTLNKPAWSDGTNWRDATGATV